MTQSFGFEILAKVPTYQCLAVNPSFASWARLLFNILCEILDWIPRLVMFGIKRAADLLHGARQDQYSYIPCTDIQNYGHQIRIRNLLRPAGTIIYINRRP